MDAEFQSIPKDIAALRGGTVTGAQFHSQSLFPLYRVEINLPDGSSEHLAVKQVASTSMAQTEAEGLTALAGHGAPVPLCYGYASGKKPLLVMRFVSSGSRSRGHIDQLIEDLVRLYSERASSYGWIGNNFIGSLSQPNGRYDDFLSFWWETRLRYQAERAIARGVLSSDFLRRLEIVTRRCAEAWDLGRAGPRLIHGDLWSGNLLYGRDGKTYMIDPSVSHAHPEQDLAMLDLFGSPLSRDEVDSVCDRCDLDPGVSDRILFWQIYPLLVHVNIFGSSYRSQLDAAIRRYE